MRKVRTILITVVILALLLAGLSYAARRRASAASNRVVEVTAVENVNDYAGYYGYGSTMEGVIISKDTQTVQRNGSYALKKIYVEEGDKVKKGDKLLEYDMEKLELEAEKAGLDKWGLELELESLEKELGLLKRGIVPVDDDSSYRYSGSTGSSADNDDDNYEDADGDVDYDYSDDEADYEDEDYVDATGSSDEELPEQELLSAQEELADDGLIAVQDDSISEDAAFDIVEDSDNEGIIEDTGEGVIIDPSGTGVIDVEDGEEEDPEIALISSVNAFLSAVNEITDVANTSLSSLGTADMAEKISDVLDTFRSQFGEQLTSEQTTVLGETITVNDYTVMDAVASSVGETTAHVMQTAYDRLCAYQFVSVMELLNADKKSSSEEGTEGAGAKINLVRAAAQLLASLPSTVFNHEEALFTTAYDALNGKWTADGKESRVEYLKNLSDLYNGSTVVEQNTEEQDTVSTEGMSPYDVDDGIDYDGDDGEDVDFAQLIKEMENAIFEQKLLIREAELEVKEYKEKLNGKIVYAVLDGVVLSSSSTGVGSDNGPIMVITGKKGLYVKGVVKENSLDTVKIGDTVYGSTYSSAPFTAEIVEISPYPETGSSYYYYSYGDDNSNESNYPFLAFIENTEGLQVDDGVELSLEGEVTGYDYASSDNGLALQSCFIRTEESGRSYCLVEGSGGVLEKRYLELGTNDWGIITIKSGLSRDDYIAFPYGKGVEEGAKTTRVDSLKAMSYESDYY